MPGRKPIPKKVGYALKTSIQAGINKQKKAGKYKLVRYKKDRAFYHSQSHQPFSVAKNEEMTNSEDEFQLLDIQRHRKIITINRELTMKQKSIMNLWNEFVEKGNQFSIKRMKMTCERFIDQYINEIREQKLYNDLMSHLISLHQGDLLKQNDLWLLIGHLQMHLGIQHFSIPVTNGKENRKRKRSSSPSVDSVEPKPKQQRYHFREANR